ncbi:MAG: hypothetical protein P0S96_07260 [Simkaniaceae bacterium]|nr:hypothetical protein [Candidatus Sacchlamyda saccharinae]
MIRSFCILFWSATLVFSCAFASSNWSTPKPIYESKNVISSDIAVNCKGDVIVVWQGSEDTGILASFYDAEKGGWCSSAWLSQDESHIHPSIVMNDEGDAIALWTSDKGIEVSHFNPLTKNWSNSVSISKVETTLRPSISMDDGGNAVIVWANKKARQIQSVSYDATMRSWSSIVTLASRTFQGYFFEESCEYNQAPKVQLNRSGMGMAVWQVLKGDLYVVQGACYDSGSQVWGEPIDFSWKIPCEIIDGNKVGPLVDNCVNEQGIATVVWNEPSFVCDMVKYVEYDIFQKARLSWSYTQIASPGVVPQVATNDAGDAAFSFFFMNKRCLLPHKTGGNSDLNNLGVFGDIIPFESRSGIDKEGNIITVWSDYTKDEVKQYAAHYCSDFKEWSEPYCLSSTPFESLGLPELDVHEEGHAAISWSVYDPVKKRYKLNVSFYYPH